MMKVSWEYVSPVAFPAAYNGSKPAMRPDDVPENWWEPVQRQAASHEMVREHYRGLVALQADGELIRNVKLWEAETPVPQWTDVTPE